MVERLGEMRKWSRERIEKRERDKTTIWREGGPERSPFYRIFYIRPCNVAIVSSSPQGITSWSSNIKFWFLQAYRMHYYYNKICHGVKQNAKICAIGETECNETWSHYLIQRIDLKRKKGWWRGRRERIEKGSRERIEIEGKEIKGKFEEEDKEHRHFPLLVVQLPQGTAFLLSSRLKYGVKRRSSEVLVSSRAAW